MRGLIHPWVLLSSYTEPPTTLHVHRSETSACQTVALNGNVRRPIGLEPLLSRNIVRREEVIVHVFWGCFKNLQVDISAEESPEGHIEFAVGEPVDIRMPSKRRRVVMAVKSLLTACLHTLCCPVQMDTYGVPTSEPLQGLANVQA
jgi:hypothetical protein